MGRVDGLDFRVLGPAEVVAEGRAVPLGGSRPLIVLAGLLLRANRVVSVDELSRWLWDDDQRRSKGALQTYVLRLRRALGEAVVIRTERGGYVLEIDPDATDLGRFRELTVRGRAAAEQGEHRRAAALFAQALAEWRGPALQNVESDALHRDETGQLAEERTRVREQWADALMAVGEYGTVVPELTRLTREHPLRERLHEQLILALFHSGRQAEALEVHRRISAVLAEELGLDPGAGLQRAHRLVLGGAPYQPAAEPQVPHQLPPDLGAFAGREADLKALHALLPADDSTSTPIASVEGMGGIGKTTLSVHFAHGIADRFPGGQIFLNLRGYGPGEPVEPLAALETLLAALGVPAEQIPTDLDGRAATWRTHTARRRLLVVLDNANSTEQVRPLVPGPGCLVVVTSRWQLRGLVATHGARRIALEELDEPDAVELLASAIGVDRVNADPTATARFVRYCGGLPLAIRILAVRAAQFPDYPLGSFVDSLEPDRLGSFDLGDGDETNIRAVFSYSYRALPVQAARLLRLLGLPSGPDVTPDVASVLLGEPASAALDALVSAHLLAQPQPGRYQFHDLIRAYAAELSHRVDSDEMRSAARLRLLDFYVASALNASRAMRPERIYESLGLEPVDGGLAFAGYHAGLAWFTEEYGNLVAAVHLAFRLRYFRHCWQLTWLMFTYFAGRGRIDEWRALNELALRGTRLSGDRRGEAGILNCLGVIDGVVRDYASARLYLSQALELQRSLGSRLGEARALYNLAMAADSRDDYPAALAHGYEALHIVRDLRLVGFEANVLRALGDLCARFGDYPRALSLADASLSLVDGDPRAGRFSLTTRAKALLGLGRHAEGIECMSDAVDQFFAVDEHYEAADVLSQLGSAHQRLGHPAAARDCWLRAARLLTDLSHPDADDVRAKLAALVGG
ncbi:BTAD domain-containing putative transcriptional regulator [Amycolatopsis sp. FDAARGOS 1241]|uniref:AfsR/SARP family transcriptional regulator n=1 Tax=Amycolatopsis sp. FDAARGOS 1241 TaxID=2778070 RepID=UPI0019527C98|nr:BTAD domain-containing putative transcriptional regulator [Amycolatopsis sp. FDAARGOS 1241]QRP46733.1 tetratricopeptide repeat protein [Amycolatopsis sp. FDAARGOS 1241]